MISKEIIDYIKAQIEKGQNNEEIKGALSSAGWQQADIDEAFKYAQSGIPLAPMSGNAQNSYQTSQTGQNVPVLASPTDLLKESWRVYKARFKVFIGISLIPAAVVAILVILLVIIVLLFKGSGDLTNFIYPSAHALVVPPSTLPIQSSPASAMSNVFAYFIGFGAIIFVLFIPLIILQLWSQAAMLFAVKDSSENIGINESYRRGWHKIGSIFWVGLLSGIIIMGGYLLFVIPGIIFGIWFSLATVIVVAEGLGGMDAILKSKSYVTGYWWEVFWRFLFIGLVLVGINLIFGIPVWIINIIAALTKSSALSGIGMIVNFIGSIVGFLLSPITVIYTFLLYKNLETIKGNTAPNFSSGEKTKFIIVGLLGILLFFGFIIGSIILVSLSGASGKATDVSRQTDIMSLQGPLMLYADDHDDTYPSSLNQLVPEYTPSIPSDRKTKLPYQYKLLKNGKDFELCATLESGAKKCINGYGNLSF